MRSMAPRPMRILPGSHAACAPPSKGIIHLHVVPLKFDLAEGIDDNGAADESMISPAKASTKPYTHFHAEGASRPSQAAFV